ncbi:MAG: hypothetical protein JRZ95_02725 [Nitrososphaerota archaeon]|nr:hypothetical protein [Nitrososphaerota archaeon]
MISKRTVIGIGVGSAIIAISIASLFLHFGIQTIEVDETFGLGEATTYRISAPEHTPQKMKITGDTFDVILESPVDGLQVPLTTHKKEVTFDWVHLADGETRINIQNTGNSEIHITATFQTSTNPLFITYDIMVIITGLVIIGLSLGFSIRKPRGF